MRYTKNNLIVDIEDFNMQLLEKGSDYSFKYQGRNGYHAVDLYKGNRCLRNVDCNEPPRKLLERVEIEAKYYLNNKD